jgi:hypothetical protein
MVGFSKSVLQRQEDTTVGYLKGRDRFLRTEIMTAQRSNEGSRAALAPGTVRPKEMHRVAMLERAAPDWPNSLLKDVAFAA